MCYYVLSTDEKTKIQDTTYMLEKEYPILDMSASRAILWHAGLDAGQVTQELFDKARSYYGTLWTYVGD